MNVNPNPMKVPVLRNLILAFVVILAILTVLALPIATEGTQIGYRGVGMEVVANANTKVALEADNAVEGAVAEVYEFEEPEPGEELAGEVYENVQVLGHLTDANFTRFMAQMSLWVAGSEDACGYCHNADEGEFAADDYYTKIVSRRMIQMTQTINSKWAAHVLGGAENPPEGGPGVNCYTCHRGNAVPEYIWFNNDSAADDPMSTGWSNDQNYANEKVGYASLPATALERYLKKGEGGEAEGVRVVDEVAITDKPGAPIQKAEWTYGLMMHWSQALGVNCTYCHNSRAWASWELSPPARVTAWHGLRLVQDLNSDYLIPLGPVYPAKRNGPLGDAPKANCKTCHQGAAKPLLGANAIAAFPSLWAPGPAGAQDPARPIPEKLIDPAEVSAN